MLEKMLIDIFWQYKNDSDKSEIKPQIGPK